MCCLKRIQGSIPFKKRTGICKYHDIKWTTENLKVHQNIPLLCNCNSFLSAWQVDWEVTCLWLVIGGIRWLSSYIQTKTDKLKCDSAMVISLGHLLWSLTPTSTLIVLATMKTSSNNNIHLMYGPEGNSFVFPSRGNFRTWGNHTLRVLLYI